MKAFYMQVDGVPFEEGARALLKASGIGKLKPNILLMGFKSDWKTCPKEELDSYFEILHIAFDLHMGVGILRLQQGLDSSKNVKLEDELQTSRNQYTSIESLPRNQSYSQMSQGKI